MLIAVQINTAASIFRLPGQVPHAGARAGIRTRLPPRFRIFARTFVAEMKNFNQIRHLHFFVG